MASPPKETITINLLDYLDDFLGENHSRPVRKYIAEILEVKLKDKLIIYVQRSDENGRELSQPILWQYKYWAESQDRERRAKIRSENERIARFLLEENVKLVARACITYFNMDISCAQATAFSIIKNNKQAALKELSVTLYKTLEEVK